MGGWPSIVQQKRANNWYYWSCFLTWLLLIIAAVPARAITSDEMLVVANGNSRDSIALARYYLKKRNIAGDRLLVLPMSLAETITREEYEDELLQPVRRKLAMLSPQRITAIVLVYGVPLKIAEGSRSQHQSGSLAQAGGQQLVAEDSGPTGAAATTAASVDSELSLAQVEDYPLEGWVENPYFPGFARSAGRLARDDVLLVCRLDGPSPQTVYRMIDDTLVTERTGLAGTAYLDARWPWPKESAGLDGYRLYDRSIHASRRFLSQRLAVVLDESEELFANTGERAPAALYVGWYSVGQYRHFTSWAKGAVAYHLASNECATLRDKTSQGWCVQLLEHGVAATIGPVNEPYVQGFPPPELFFRNLSEGYLNLGESYLVAVPYFSWQMVLVGDPLYLPFPIPLDFTSD